MRRDVRAIAVAIAALLLVAPPAAARSATLTYVVADGQVGFGTIDVCGVRVSNDVRLNAVCFDARFGESVVTVTVDDALPGTVLSLVNTYDRVGRNIDTVVFCGTTTAQLSPEGGLVSVGMAPAWIAALEQVFDVFPDCDHDFATTGTVTATFA